jgi:predicted AAA+ superfamily ATPase
MSVSAYIPRIADRELESRLRRMGAVLIEGPKACGKTETARQLAASEVRLDVDAGARATLAVEPALVLAGEAPRLIDEWQVEPNVWNLVRRAVDDSGQVGRFILTGSAVPADEVTRHSGAGRFSRLRMRPMSLAEAGLSDGSISLAELIGGGVASCPDRGIGLADLVDAIVRGGWPALQKMPIEGAAASVADYLEEVAHTDISRLDGVRHDPARVRRLLRSLARNVATHVTIAKLAAETADPGAGPLKNQTVSAYLAALGRLFVVESQPPWQPHLRSRSILRKSAKRHFVDPSLAAAALGADPAALLKDLNLLGFLFESLVVRDLRVYSQPLGGEVRQYLDNKGLEVDAIIQTKNAWAAFEVKLGGEEPIDEAASSLLKFAGEIDTEQSGESALLAVIVATGYGYVREDGVQVIPITSLGP